MSCQATLQCEFCGEWVTGSCETPQGALNEAFTHEMEVREAERDERKRAHE